MNRRLGILTVLILTLAACGREAAPPVTQSTPGTEVRSSAAAPNPPEAEGAIPDPCTLLSDAEVTELTGRDITQIDRDGADANIDPLLPVAAELGSTRRVPLAHEERRLRGRQGGPAVDTGYRRRRLPARWPSVRADRRGPDRRVRARKATTSRARPTRKRLRARLFRECLRSPELPHLERQADTAEDPGDVRHGWWRR